MESPSMKRKWFFSIMISSLICVFLLATSFNIGVISSMHTINHIFCVFPSQNHSMEAYTKLSQPKNSPTPSTLRFAYLISGSKGEMDKLWRTLHALYHPSNHYVVHLDLESPAEERMELASCLEKHPIFSSVGNVYMVLKANMVTYRGPTMVANTLHLHVFYPQPNSQLHRAYKPLGWKVVNIMTRVSIGSAWMVLTRSFVEYLIWGWDNLPRVLLMYYANFISSLEGYFHTVICNAPEFAQTAINHDLHYIAWDNPPKQHPHFLSVNDTQKMIESGAVFARKFSHNDPVLDVIDRELLGRSKDGFTPGGWCADGSKCSVVGDPNTIKPVPGADRVKGLMDRVVMMSRDKKHQCIWNS